MADGCRLSSARIRLTSARLQEDLAYLAGKGFSMYALQWEDELTASFQIPAREEKLLLSTAQKRGCKVKTIRKAGFQSLFLRLRRRKLLISGLIILAFLSAFVPTRVFVMEVKGNERVPEARILEALQDCGLTFGCSARSVRSEDVKNKLLSQIPELKWAGVNLNGCKAVIQVCETASAPARLQETGICHIVANCPGMIRSVTVVEGSACVSPGKAVEKGDILISGYADAGNVLLGTAAEGAVIADTYRTVRAIMPDSQIQKLPTGRVFHAYGLLLGKYRINLRKDSRISDGTCDRMYEEYYLALPGGFHLPIAWTRETFREWTAVSLPISPGEAAQVLKDYAERYLSSLMVEGRQLSCRSSVSRHAGAYRLEASCRCRERIDRVQREMIGDLHGKSN